MRFPSRRRAATALSFLLAALVAGAFGAPPASATPPQPCGGVPQITDVEGDGHHSSSDVLAAWFSEESGHLQAVIKVRSGTWEPEHEDAEEDGSGFAMIYNVGGVEHYVRARAWLHDEKPIGYDYGTWAPGSWFTSQGSTTGSVEYATYGGTVTIDVPEATGAVAGARLAGPWVMTYDGITGGVPGWVDHAPGGTGPTDTSRGADYVVGSCRVASGGGAGGATASEATVAVQLTAPAERKGAGKVRLSGKVVPGRAGVPVVLTVTAKGAKPRRVALTSGEGGAFATTLAIDEVTRVRAEAEGIASQTDTIAVASTVKVRLARGKGGALTLIGKVDPGLPGRVLLLPVDEVTQVASAPVHGRGFTLSLGRRQLPPGGYQVVYIPSRARAERSTSNTVRIKAVAVKAAARKGGTRKGGGQG